jgi:hypothetical protein
MKIPSVLTYAVCSITLLAGCGKKESEAPAPAKPTASASVLDQAVQASAAKTPPATAVQPDTSQAALADAQAAMRARNYDKAAQLLLSLQAPSKQPLTPEQAAAVANQMRQFQRDLGGAVARGDPAAIAAAQRLRAASTPH